MNRRLHYLKASALIIARQNAIAEPLLMQGHPSKIVSWLTVYETTEYHPPEPKSDTK